MRIDIDRETLAKAIEALKDSAYETRERAAYDARLRLSAALLAALEAAAKPRAGYLAQATEADRTWPVLVAAVKAATKAATGKPPRKAAGAAARKACPTAALLYRPADPLLRDAGDPAVVEYRALEREVEDVLDSPWTSSAQKDRERIRLHEAYARLARRK